MRLYDYAASANCYKARLLLALLEREYERVPVDIFAGDTLTEEFAGLNPARETPVLELDDGTVLTQSNAILWFLGEETAFLPESAFERGRVAQWLFFEQERVMSGIGSARFRFLTGEWPASDRVRAAPFSARAVDADRHARGVVGDGDVDERCVTTAEDAAAQAGERVVVDGRVDHGELRGVSGAGGDPAVDVLGDVRVGHGDIEVPLQPAATHARAVADHARAAILQPFGARALPNGDDLALGGLFLGGVGNNQTALGLLLASIRRIRTRS